jgi:catechol 2,3-dioxygenase-like lactoylglutathione lyase family enzyme
MKDVTLMKDLPQLGRSFDQICFVVPDLEKAVDYWRRVNGVQAWSIAYDLAKPQTEKEYLGQPGDFQFSCAYGFAGDTLIELARHDGGRSLYKDWIDRKGYGVHHVGFRLPDSERFGEADQYYRDSGFWKVMTGLFRGPSGSCRWAYYDTLDAIGCYTELYYLDGDFLGAMERMRAGEVVSVTG